MRQLKDGRVIVADPPKKRKKHSPKQKKHLNHFEYAKYYSKQVGKRAALRERYERGARGTKLNWQNLAIQDFMKPPVISEIAVDFYAGEPGEVIRIRATDNFIVVSVRVKITGANRRIIEAGKAQPRGKRGLWRFFTAVKNPKSEGTRITVTATDLAENSVTAVLACSDVVGEQSKCSPYRRGEVDHGRQRRPLFSQ